MKIHHERVAKERFKLKPQIRQHSPEYLRRLAHSLLRGQLQPVGTLADYTVIWGNRRVLAARKKWDRRCQMHLRRETRR